MFAQIMFHFLFPLCLFLFIQLILEGFEIMASEFNSRNEEGESQARGAFGLGIIVGFCAGFALAATLVDPPVKEATHSQRIDHSKSLNDPNGYPAPIVARLPREIRLLPPG